MKHIEYVQIGIKIHDGTYIYILNMHLQKSTYNSRRMFGRTTCRKNHVSDQGKLSYFKGDFDTIIKTLKSVNSKTLLTTCSVKDFWNSFADKLSITLKENIPTVQI